MNALLLRMKRDSGLVGLLRCDVSAIIIRIADAIREHNSNIFSSFKYCVCTLTSDTLEDFEGLRKNIFNLFPITLFAPILDIYLDRLYSCQISRMFTSSYHYLLEPHGDV